MKDKLKEIEELCNNATEGPWDYYIDYENFVAGIESEKHNIFEDDLSMVSTDDMALTLRFMSSYQKNFPLMAQSRTLVPKLVEALRIADDAMEQTLDEITRDYAFKGKTLKEAREQINKLLEGE